VFYFLIENNMNKKLLQDLDAVISREYDNHKYSPSLLSITREAEQLIWQLLTEKINWEIVDNWILEYYIKNFKYFKKRRLNFLSAYEEIKQKLNQEKSIQYVDIQYSNNYESIWIKHILKIFNKDYREIILMRLEWYSHTLIISSLWISRRTYYKKIKHIKEILNSLFFKS